MKLAFDSGLAEPYRSWPQKIRVMSERWLHEHFFCPACGRRTLRRCDANAPVADFVCQAEHCREEFELKSKNGAFGQKIVDGAYSTMMSRLGRLNNPNLILLSDARTSLSVQKLLVIPKQFFTSDVIERRPPLSGEARRKGWVGCNILIGRIPTSGRIIVISPGRKASSTDVVRAWNEVLFVRNIRPDKMRGWLLAVFDVVEKLGQEQFTLRDVYQHAPALAARFSENRNIHAKIRQQLQVLRDNGILDFLGGGVYSKRSYALKENCMN